MWDRFVALSRPGQSKLAPNAVLVPRRAAHPRRGLSARKVEYVRDSPSISSRARCGGAWREMDDEAIIDELVAIRGIGRWTAEMFLIFHLMRPNVLPLDDLGLIKGISLNYFSGEPVSRAEAREVGDAWARTGRSPLGTSGAASDAAPTGQLRAAPKRQQEVDEWQRRHFLDFEQPVAELETKIEELRYVQNESAVDISEEIDRLSKKSLQLTKDIYSSLTPWQVTQIARHPQRPYTLDYVNEMFTDFQELHGDRAFADDQSIVGGLARFNGQPAW